MKSRKPLNILLRLVLAGLISLVLILAVPSLAATFTARSRLYPVESVPPARVAIVFGAGLTRNRTPSAVLRDRIETAVALYESGKVDKLLMSGDNRFVDYNEPGAMRDYAVDLGVPEEDIVNDYAGRRTYDTCYRARAIFGVQEAILVTQSFHMPRALFLCNTLGIAATGVTSDVRNYRRISYVYWVIREIPATTMAFWEALVWKPLPVLGEPEPIFSDQSSGMNIATYMNAWRYGWTAPKL